MGPACRRGENFLSPVGFCYRQPACHRHPRKPPLRPVPPKSHRTFSRANPVPALSLAVMRGNQLAWAQAFGTADIEMNVAVTTEHKFRLGSGAKPVTATLAALMTEEGIVDLDQPIGQYMPDLPPMHRATTLRQLLTHRGGIRSLHGSRL